jgi:hypothetical protein
VGRLSEGPDAVAIGGVSGIDGGVVVVAGASVAILWEKMQRGTAQGRLSSRAGHGTSANNGSGLNIAMRRRQLRANIMSVAEKTDKGFC